MKRLMIAAMVLAGAMLGIAMPASATPVLTPAAQYCSSIVSKELDEHGLSKVVGTSCSSQSPEAAHRLAAASAGVPTDAATAASTLLMNEYRDTSYNGGVIYTYYGSSGACDSAGYRLQNYSSVGHATSSITGYNNCNVVRIQGYNSTAEGVFTLPAPGLNSVYSGYYNDNVNIVRVYHG